MTRRRRLYPRIVGAVGVVLGLVAANPVAATEPSDELFKRQWNLQMVRAPEAWATSTGKGVTVAVIDSGIDFSHPDLAPNALPGASFVGCPTNGPCGIGSWRLPGDDPSKSNSHGTRVTSVLAAARNGSGMVGVAPDVKVLPIRVGSDESSGFATGALQELALSIAAGLDWATKQGAKVVSISMSTPLMVFLEPEVEQAVERTLAAGVVIVASASNDSVLPCQQPSGIDGVICVAAVDREGLRTSYSNFAVKGDQLAVAAPGGENPIGGEGCDTLMIAALPVEWNGGCEHLGVANDYHTVSGTSGATPHVSGVAALLAAQGRSRDNIIEAILQTARNPHTGERGKWDPLYGHGIVDAAAAVAYPKG